MFSFKKGVGALFFACCLCFSSVPGLADDQTNTLKSVSTVVLQPGSIGIKLTRNSKGNLDTVIFNPDGKQESLTFGNFISFSVEAILGQKMDICKVNQTQPIFVGYEWKNKILYSFINTVDGDKSVFTIPQFLGTLADTISSCQKWDQNQNPQPKNTAAILFEKKKGNFQTMIVDMKGKKDKLNLGNLLSVSSEAFPDCAPGVEKDRVLQILIDDSNPDNLMVYQVDAYGLKEDLNFDNLSTAAAETLESCAKDANKSFAPLQPNSIRIKFEKNKSGNLQTYLMTPAGDKVELNLGTLLAAAAQTVPSYQGKSGALVISYDRDQKGEVTGTLTDLSGNTMDLNLENLVKSAALFSGY